MTETVSAIHIIQKQTLFCFYTPVTEKSGLSNIKFPQEQTIFNMDPALK